MTARAAISWPSSSWTRWRSPPARGRSRGTALRAERRTCALANGAARQLGAADPGREAEKVLDPAGDSGLASESCALDHERVEPLRGAVDGRGEPCRAAADDQQVDLLPWRQLTADPEGPQDVAGRRLAQLVAAGEPHERRLFAVRWRLVVPGVGQPVGAREVEHPHRCLGRTRAEDLDADAFDALQGLPPRDERRQHEIAQRGVLEQQRAEHVPVDCDVAQRLRRHHRPEDGLAGEEVQLAEEAGGAVADELLPVASRTATSPSTIAMKG